VARALLTGMPDAVREMLRVLASGRDL
jgi:hypothetical protein